MDLATKNAVWRKPSNNEKRLIKDLHYNDNLNGCKRFNFEYDELRLLSWADEIVEGASIFCLDIPDGVFIIYVSQSRSFRSHIMSSFVAILTSPLEITYCSTILLKYPSASTSSET